MKLARYRNGTIFIDEEPKPLLPDGGLLVQTEACGLCSGELMGWYMEQKSDPVLGHEVAGRVIESDDPRFPLGSRVFPHHHAPCMVCKCCRRGAYVQCDTWRNTRLTPGGMAEIFAVQPENLVDTHLVDDLRAIDAALVEPLACVVKSLRQARWSSGMRFAVIGLGNMGLMHMLALGPDAVGFELEASRRAHAMSLGLSVQSPNSEGEYDIVFVCPGTPVALELAFTLVVPRGTILLFAPFGPCSIPTGMIDQLYFKDLTLSTSYSAGPDDTVEALRLLRNGVLRAEQVVSNFISLEQLPAHYEQMRAGQILKAMVAFEATG